MAMTQVQKADAYKFFVVAFGAVPGVEYMNQLDQAYSAGMTTQQIVNVYTTKPEFLAQYPNFLTNEQFAAKVATNVIGDSATAEVRAEVADQIVAAINAGYSRGDVIFQIFNNLSDKADTDPLAGTAKMMANKVAVAQYLTEVKLVADTDMGKLQSPLVNVGANTDVSSPEAIEKLTGTTQTELTLGRDVISATQGGQTFSAPIVQNAVGAVANTFESGDVINAVGTGNKLVADITASGLVGGSTTGPVISATTKNIQVVEFRAQSVGQSGGVHTGGGVIQSTIDAQKMEGVQQWWSVDSRNDLKIEDVRTRPEDTTIGMRNTDPEVAFKVYFDPEQLKANGTVKNSALTLTLDKIATPGDLSNNVFNGVKFTLGGKVVVLQSDAIGAATNHAQLLAALEAAAAGNADLAGVTFKLNANNTITLTDPAGKAFGTGSWLTPTGDIPAVGDFKWAQAVGEPDRGVELITTQVELDNVGRTSAGDELDIASLGNGGVEKFNVTVDRASWLTKVHSRDHAGTGNSFVDTEDGQAEYLQEVHLFSKGANGNLKLGQTVADRLDGRLAGGLTDVRVVDGSAFKGDLNLGIKLTAAAGDGSVARYLDKSTKPVEFNYTASAGKDVLNIEVAANVANHANFVMNVDAGAGDDRVILTNGGRLNTTSVDGGTGNNTIVMNADVGMTPASTFKSFKNFQNYEIEGGNHNFTGLTGVQNVTVATFVNAATTLRNLPVDLNTVTVTGKNQTAGAGNANNHQTFSGLTLEAAKSETATVKLDNTALVNGRLVEADLIVKDQNATNLSAVRTLNVESKGVSGALTGNYVGGVILANGSVTGMATDADVATAVAALGVPAQGANPATLLYLTRDNAKTALAADPTNTVLQTALANAETALANGLAAAGKGIDAAKVSTFNFSGDHALGARINEAANPTGLATGVTDLKVDATGMTAKFDLAVSTAVINRSDLNKTVNLKGGSGTSDTLVLSAGLNTTAKTTVAGFETISFNGAAGGGNDSKYDAVNTSGVNLYKSNGAQLQVLNLKSVENVELGSFVATGANTGVATNVGGHQWFKTTAVSSASTLNLTAKNAVAPAAAQEIATDGFKTVNLKLDVVANTDNIKAFVLDMSKVSLTVAPGNVVTERTLAQAVQNAVGNDNKAKVIKEAVENLVITGGTGTFNAGVAVDSVKLEGAFTPGTDAVAGVKSIQTLNYTGYTAAFIDAGDVVTANVGGVVYSVPGNGNAATTLNDLVTAINAGTATHGFAATVNAGVVTLTASAVGVKTNASGSYTPNGGALAPAAQANTAVGADVTPGIAGTATTELSSSLKLIDVTGYKGTVSAKIGDALTSGAAVGHADYANTGNTTVKVGAYGINFMDAKHIGVHVDTVTTFVFTTDAYKDAAAATAEKWQISNFQGIKAGAAGTAGSLDNLTVLDLSALGIKGLQDMQITEAVVGGHNVVTIQSNFNQKFVIELTGVNKDQLDLANFKFAV